MNLSGIRDVNELKRLLAMGAISQDQLNNSNISGSFGPDDNQQVPQNALQNLVSPQDMQAPQQMSQQPQQMPQQQPPDGSNFVRNEQTGHVTYLTPQGLSDRPSMGAVIQPQQQPPRMMKVIGAGGGTRVDLSPEQAPDKVNLDYSRSPYELMGGARAIYSKDEPGTAYVMGPDGRPSAKIILGYDMQGSMALNKANAEMAKTQADTAHTQEETRVSQVNNPDFSSGNGAPGSLGSLDAGTAATVKQMLEGRMPFPGNMALRNPRVMQLLNIANQVDPNFDAATWKRRADTTDEFSKGKSFQSINALNTVSGHLDTFDKAVDALNNTNYRAVNAVINPIAEQLGSTKQTDFATTLKTLAPELERAYRGAGGSESSIEAWRTALSGNNGYDQQKSAIRQLAGLLHSKIDALGYSYSQGMNKNSNGYDLLSPQAQTVFSKLSGMNAAPQSGGQVQQPQSNIPAGAISFLRSNPASRYDFDRKYGQGASAQVLGNG